MEVNRGCHSAAACHGERCRPERVIEHRRDDAALYEAGRVCELGLGQKLDLYRASLRVEGDKLSSEQSGDGRHRQVVEDRLDHSREAPLSLTLAIAC